MRKWIFLIALFCFGLAFAAAPSEEAKKHFNSGVNAEKAGKVDEAITEYEAAVKVSPDYLDAHKNLAAAYKTKNNLPLAITHLEAVAKVEPSAGKWDTIGSLAMTAKDYIQAVAAYEKAVELKPNNAKMMLALADAYKKDRQTTKAVETYKKVIAADPKNAAARFNLGKTYFDNEDYAQAKAVFKEMTTAVPADPRSFYMYAVSVHSEDPENIDAYQPLYEDFIKRFKGNPKATTNVKQAEKVIDQIKNPKKN